MDSADKPGVELKVTRTLSVTLGVDDLAAVEAWRAANMKSSLEEALIELVRRGLMDEISSIQALVSEVRESLIHKMRGGNGAGDG